MECQDAGPEMDAMINKVVFGEMEVYVPVVPYSTSFAAALGILEKAAEWRIEKNEYGIYEAEMSVHKSSICSSSYASADTPALAICKVALLAMTGDAA